MITGETYCTPLSVGFFVQTRRGSHKYQNEEYNKTRLAARVGSRFFASARHDDDNLDGAVGMENTAVVVVVVAIVGSQHPDSRLGDLCRIECSEHPEGPQQQQQAADQQQEGTTWCCVY